MNHETGGENEQIHQRTSEEQMESDLHARIAALEAERDRLRGGLMMARKALLARVYGCELDHVATDINALLVQK